MNLRPLLTVLALAALPLHAQIPTPLPGNPGNIFLAGQTVSVALPPGARHWQILAYGGRLVAQGDSENGHADLGRLPLGFYWLNADGTSAPITLAVLKPLAAPTPADSPIAVDSSAGLFYQTPDQWKAAANLMALAGIKWERDRFKARFVEPQGRVPLNNPYDQETAIMHDSGLKVLDTMMGSPWWMAYRGDHLPTDLRDVYQFYRDIASRWRGTVDAFEPSNESDVHNTGAEIASFQKAAYLGLKAGNPSLIVCSSPWSSGKVPLEMQEYQNNEVGAYFDTLDFHHYQPLDQLPAIFSDFRALTAGKPIWVTEFNMQIPIARYPVTQDPDISDERVTAQNVAKLYATSLFLGSQRSFYFSFGNYVEGHRQFGLLRQDLTPRPGYVALAAVGRLLAGAKPIAHVHASENPAASLYAFSALPDGRRADVLIAWNPAPTELRLPVTPIAVYDLIGRKYSPSDTKAQLQLTQSPLFIVLPPGTVKNWGADPSNPQLRAQLEWPPASQGSATAAVSPFIMQVLFPAGAMLHSPDHRVGQTPASASIVQFGALSDQHPQAFAYNFSNHTLEATLAVQVSSGWTYSLPSRTITVPAMGRVQIPLQLSSQDGSQSPLATIRIIASGQSVGRSVLEFHLVP